MKVILIGFMGCGKTTVGRELAKQMNLPQYDLDQMIVKNLNEPISNFFKEKGEAAFRDFEHQMLNKSLSLDGILSTGGGTPVQKQNQNLFHQTSVPIMMLDASDDVIRKRLSLDANRPIVEKLGMDGIIKLKHQRDATYRMISNQIILTDHKSPLTIAKKIIENLKKESSK
ncbi:shikimate kinase [Philodulcilactobacillus myokoensis]|uniref:Shikimate kinase n=1 Tax=Philodulcilactobacillus myokoensis TaxID=2929573 RepID=A0A9W6B352_9LACO|nr:shikimate kinase [Philodulcilactobacillus myokoensis]GLB47491.1 shikimate kinase [Philodulcilactobacillus myokoensis]